MGRNATDLTGGKYGTLEPRRRLAGKGKAKWSCLCRVDWGGCGGTVDVYAQNLVGGQTKSCGCRRGIRAPRACAQLITLPEDCDASDGDVGPC